MKRRIIFKAKEVNTNKWVFGNFVMYGGHQETFTHAIQVLDDEMNVRYVANIQIETLCQFTGVNDFNGRSVFEGDLMQHIDKFEKPLEVIYNEERTSFELNNGDTSYSINDKNLYVIDNIHNR